MANNGYAEDIFATNKQVDPVIAEIKDVPTGAEQAESVLSAFTADDLHKAREQEKSKLYSQMEKLKSEVDTLKKEREEAAAQAAAAQAAIEAERLAKVKAQEEEELSAKELLAKKEQEWNAQLEHERLERERAFALLEKDREFQELQNYRQARLEQERENIVPQLIDLINGNTPDEIEQSIASLKEKSAGIMSDVMQTVQASKQQMVGARITAPASGPLDNDSEQRSYSPDAIRDMPMADYMKQRSKLLGQAASNRGQGLFGN
jgi:hypothetical protein